MGWSRRSNGCSTSSPSEQPARSFSGGMMDASSIGIVTAFIAGIISFLSPCVLPVVPGYVAYIAGQGAEAAIEEVAMDRRRRLTALMLSAFFVLGFGAVFVALGASATAIGRFFLRY